MKAAKSDQIRRFTDAAQRLLDGRRCLSARQMRRVPTVIKKDLDELSRVFSDWERLSEGTIPGCSPAATDTMWATASDIDRPGVAYEGIFRWASLRPGARLRLVGYRGCMTSPIRALTPLAKGRYFIETRNSGYILSLSSRYEDRYGWTSPR